MIKICKDESLDPVLDLIAQAIDGGKQLILLQGDLGAGKTHLVKAYVKRTLGVSADSPSFSLVNSYKSGNNVVHHFDLYRLQTVEEIIDLGFWDYVDQGYPCFIEWPHKIAELLPAESSLKLSIDLTLDQCREYSLYS